MQFPKFQSSPQLTAGCLAIFATLAAFFQGLASRNHEVNTVQATGLFEVVDQNVVGLLLLTALVFAVAFYWTTLGRNIPVFASAVAIAALSFSFSFGPGFLIALFYMLTSAIIEFIRQTTGRTPSSAFAPYDTMAYLALLVLLWLAFVTILGGHLQTLRHGKTLMGWKDAFVLVWIAAALLLTLKFCCGLFVRVWQLDARYYWCGMIGVAAGPFVVGFTTAQLSQFFQGAGTFALMFLPFFLFALAVWIASIVAVASLLLTGIANRPAGVLRLALD